MLRLKEDNKLPKETLGRINEQIRDRRFWRVFYEAGDFRVGVWRRSE